MLYVNITPEFRAGALRKLRDLTPAAANMRLKLFKGASPAAIGAVAGWGAVVAIGAMLVSSASHDHAPNAPEALPPMTAFASPPAPVVAQAVKETAAAPSPAPSPSPTKTSQRVDMTPTASIPETPKPHHKPHKKKLLDNSN